MAFGQTCFDYAEAFRSTARNFRGVSCDLAPARCVFLTIEFALSARRHATVKVEIDQSRLRIPVKATMHSGAWRPLDPVE